jgi:hypothetical protein
MSLHDTGTMNKTTIMINQNCKEEIENFVFVKKTFKKRTQNISRFFRKLQFESKF